MKVHHTGHHQAYTDKLNAAWETLKTVDPTTAALPLAEVLQKLPTLPSNLQGPIRNNGGGFVNHKNFFVDWMAPNAGGAPTGDLATAINTTFGSFDGFKQQFSDAAALVFCSGWAWLVVDKTGASPILRVAATPNQDTPASTPKVYPILGLDVWEHAYYLKYQNKRLAYINAWWNVVNWPRVNEMYNEALLA